MAISDLIEEQLSQYIISPKVISYFGSKLNEVKGRFVSANRVYNFVLDKKGVSYSPAGQGDSLLFSALYLERLDSARKPKIGNSKCNAGKSYQCGKSCISNYWKCKKGVRDVNDARRIASILASTNEGLKNKVKGEVSDKAISRGKALFEARGNRAKNGKISKPKVSNQISKPHDKITDRIFSGEPVRYKDGKDIRVIQHTQGITTISSKLGQVLYREKESFNDINDFAKDLHRYRRVLPSETHSPITSLTTKQSIEESNRKFKQPEIDSNSTTKKQANYIERLNDFRNGFKSLQDMYLGEEYYSKFPLDSSIQRDVNKAYEALQSLDVDGLRLIASKYSRFMVKAAQPTAGDRSKTGHHNMEQKAKLGNYASQAADNIPKVLKNIADDTGMYLSHAGWNTKDKHLEFKEYANKRFEVAKEELDRATYLSKASPSGLSTFTKDKYNKKQLTKAKSEFNRAEKNLKTFNNYQD